MRILLLLCIAISINSSFAQTTTDEDLQKIWQTNVQPIIDLNIEQLKTSVQVPLGGDWFEEIDPEMWEDDVTEEFFYDNIETIFTEDARNYLAGKDYNALSVMGDEDWTVVTLLIVLSEDEDGFAEESMGLEFEWVEDKWLLTGVTFY
ncbi:MAG: hypothetical protein NXI10_07510 [bacterium]|nr:hypothetical protein [bacterium]